MVAVNACFKPESALRDVAMAYGRPEAELKTMARLIREWDDGIQGIQGNPLWAPILTQAVALQGHFHQLSVHPGGTIIAPGPLWHHVPFQPAPAKEEVYSPSHPVLASLLSDNYEILVCHEDVVRVGMAMAGWSHEEADKLRKVLGKPDCSVKLPTFEVKFREGCAGQGIPSTVVDEVWDMIRTFRDYSFCKPHSASYAQVSFESAWIKAHHPAVFFASVITNQGGYYPPIAYLGDARRHNLVVRGPDVNQSAWPFTAEGERGLRVGLMQVKGAREDEVHALLEERQRNGP